MQEIHELPKRRTGCTTNATSSLRGTKWLPPIMGQVKMNVDAAVAKSSNFGVVGVVCRSDRDVFLGASAVVFQGVTEPATL